MIRKILAVPALLMLTAGLSLGESSRLMLSVENKMPDLHQLELGVAGQYQEVAAAYPLFSDAETFEVVPYARYGLFRNFTVFTRVPFMSVDPDFGDSADGLGDVSAGFELVAFEDYFDFPYIIPHVEVFFDTGDEEKGLGFGETREQLGVSVGTVVDDQWHYVVDFSYMICQDMDNYFMVSGGFVWDLNEQCSLLLEGRATEEEFEGESYTLFGQGGLTYNASKALAYTMYVGAGDKEDSSVGLKVAYSF